MNTEQAKRRKIPSQKIREMTETSEREKIEKMEEIFNHPLNKPQIAAGSYPDRTVIWRGKEALIRKEDNVLMQQNISDGAFLCYMGRCSGLASYDSEDLFLAHVSESHCKSGAKGGMAFQFWRWRMEKPLQCPDCNLRFAESAKLADHECDKNILQNAHLQGRSVGAGEKPKIYYECSFCGLRSTTASGKLNHERTHFEKRNVFGDPLRCKKCDFKAASESQLWIHQSEHTTTKRKEDDALTQSSLTAAKRRKSELIVPSPTSTPELRGSSNDDLIASVFPIGSGRDLTRKEKMTLENRLLESTNKYPECGFCGKVFFSQASLQKHSCSRMHAQACSRMLADACSTSAASGTASTASSAPCSSSSTSSSSPSDPLFSCSLCSVTFPTRDSFARHCLSSHPLCRFCQKRFPDETRLKAHVDSQQHPKCDLCSEMFADAAKLADHVDKRHPKWTTTTTTTMMKKTLTVKAGHAVTFSPEENGDLGKRSDQETSLSNVLIAAGSEAAVRGGGGGGGDALEKLKDSLKNSSKPTKPILACHLCGEEFQSQVMILMHQAEIHSG